MCAVANVIKTSHRCRDIVRLGLQMRNEYRLLHVEKPSRSTATVRTSWKSISTAIQRWPPLQARLRNLVYAARTICQLVFFTLALIKTSKYDCFHNCITINFCINICPFIACTKKKKKIAMSTLTNCILNWNSNIFVYSMLWFYFVNTK